MIFIQNLLIIVCCSVFALAAGSQPQQDSINKVDRQEPFPGLKDWFLSTGNWEKDPQLYVLEFGTGRDTIIMVHGGWGAEHSGLINAIRNLKDQYHFVFYDQRGSLRSFCPDTLISFNNHIEDLELLRKELNIGKLIIVAHSMGAIVASAYAAKYPLHVKQLILLAPMYLKDPIPEEDKQLLDQSSKALDKFMKRPEVPQELDKLGLNRTSPALSSREETAKFRINLYGKRMLYDVSKWPQLMGGRGLNKFHVYQLTVNTYPKGGWNYLQEFNRQTYPVSIITGDHDFLDFRNSLYKKWSAEASRIKLSIIKNAGHFIWVDQPEAM